MTPSDEKLVFKLDSQITNSMDLCWERYRLEMVEHWRPLKKAAALQRGSIMHTLLKHYRLGKKAGRTDQAQHAQLVNECIAIGKVTASSSDLTVIEYEDDIATFKDYILKWQYDGWEIIDVEQPFSKVLYEDNNPIEFGGRVYAGLVIIYEGVVDARIRDPRLGLAVVDSKTESRRSYPYILSNQFQGYEWAFSCPVVVDKIGFQKSLEATEEEPDEYGRDKSKFRRIVHDSGGFALEEWRRDCIIKVKEAIEWHRKLADGSWTQLPKNRTSCDKYSGCIYQRVCKVPEESRQFKLQAYYFKDKPWDPYTRDDELVEDE
jgi:hypothetical protein